MLLIATPNQILTYDPRTGGTRLLRLGDGEFYGITWNEQGAILTHSNHENEALSTHADYRAAARGWLSLDGPSGGRKAGEACLLQPHQVEWVEDRAVAVNTGLNGLSTFSADGRLLQTVHLGGRQWDKGPDGSQGNHFNSVCRHGDRLLVLAHNHARPSAIWSLGWPDLEVQEVRETAASWAHNIWVGEHGTVICDSKGGSLVSVETGETLWKAEEPRVITRGLAVVGDHLYIGRSEYGDRSERKRNDGGVWIVDRKTLRTLDCHRFPGSGCVNEVRGISGLDECHVPIPFQPAWLASIRQVGLRDGLAYAWNKASRSLHSRQGAG